MAAPVPPGAPRPGYNSPPAPGYNPNLQRGVDGLSNNMQNLQINRQQLGPNTAPMRPPPPFAQPGYPGTGQVTRPGPPPGLLNRPVGPPTGMLPQNAVAVRPSAPPPSQPSPFAARGPPVSGPSAVTGAVLRPSVAPSGQVPLPFSANQGVPRPGLARATGPSMSTPFAQLQSTPGTLSNGPPVFGSAGLPRGPPFITHMNQQHPSLGAPPMMMRPAMGPQNAQGSVQPGQPHSPFPVSSQGIPPPPGSPFGSQQSWPMQTPPVSYQFNFFSFSSLSPVFFANRKSY